MVFLKSRLATEKEKEKAKGKRKREKQKKKKKKKQRIRIPRRRWLSSFEGKMLNSG